MGITHEGRRTSLLSRQRFRQGGCGNQAIRQDMPLRRASATCSSQPLRKFTKDFEKILQNSANIASVCSR